jgi:hypothetical protein
VRDEIKQGRFSQEANVLVFTDFFCKELARLKEKFWGGLGGLPLPFSQGFGVLPSHGMGGAAPSTILAVFLFS